MYERARSVIRSLRRRIRGALRNARVLSPLRIDRAVAAERASGETIENLQVLQPAESEVRFGANARDGRFLSICKYYREGYYSRPDVLVCEVPGAFYEVETGLVCTRDFVAVSDSQMEYRLGMCPAFGWFKPRRVRHLAGTYATISNLFSNYWWHWLVDCLPRIQLLEKAFPGQHIVLLMPENMGVSFVESLTSALPSTFEVRYLPADSWVKVDRMLLPSYLSGRCNGHLPAEYYDSLRRTVFARLGLSPTHEPTERIYVSRARAVRRRIVNESELVELLGRYGFRSVAPETLRFREQVELFNRAQVIVSAHGSNWGNILFSGKIKLLVLYPDRAPNTHIFTMAKALGQEHFFLAGEEPSEDSDFEVELAAVERVLKDEMGLDVA